MNNIAEHQDSDPVTVGIREWQKVKASAEEAIERARKAEEEASYYRGQCELMQSQRKTDDATMRRLQQHCDEMNIMVESLGAAVLSIIEKRKLGYFRRAGSNGGSRPGDFDDDMHQLIAGLARHETHQPSTRD